MEVSSSTSNTIFLMSLWRKLSKFPEVQMPSTLSWELRNSNKSKAKRPRKPTNRTIRTFKMQRSKIKTKLALTEVSD
jgi:uncharacterized protein YjiS (DUF1127 family)